MRVLLVIGAILLASAPAQAGNLEEAQAAVGRGKQAFERGDYDTALAQFQAADGLAPSPNISYNIGATYEALGKYHDAALAFERYLELAGPPTTDNDRVVQEGLKARIDADKGRSDGPPTPAPRAQPQSQSPLVLQQPPPAPTADPARRRRRAIALTATGVVLTVIGIPLLIGGAVLAVQPESPCPSMSEGCITGLNPVFGGLMAGIGAVLTAAGIPLTVVGGVQLTR
jgi:hypothetical protein